MNMKLSVLVFLEGLFYHHKTVAPLLQPLVLLRMKDLWLQPAQSMSARQGQHVINFTLVPTRNSRYLRL